MSFPGANLYSPARNRLLFGGAAAAALLTLLAYRELFARPFAADDYQWLLQVRRLNVGELLYLAFDPAAQTHFYRPLVWGLFWVQVRLFGMEPFGFHAISLALHLLNAALAGFLAMLLAGDMRHTARAGVATMLIAALHPAPFEAVTWVSAQSELLAATLLLLMTICWVRGRTGIATCLLLLALLAKESAVIGFGLLVVLSSYLGFTRMRFRALVVPLLISCVYLGMQLTILGRNTVVQDAGYGIGPQLVENPLRSLALVFLPLPGTEHADAGWLVPAGALITLALAGVAAWRRNRPFLHIAAAMLLVLLPTAPFVSPPDSRYLYLAVLVAAVGVGAAGVPGVTEVPGAKAPGYGAPGYLFVVVIIALCAAYAVHETAAREGRFAASSGPGGSLWQLTGRICRDVTPRHMFLVDPPLAAPHAAAIVELACGSDVDLRIVTRAELDARLVPESVVIGFPGGSAAVERWV